MIEAPKRTTPFPGSYLFCLRGDKRKMPGNEVAEKDFHRRLTFPKCVRKPKLSSQLLVHVPPLMMSKRQAPITFHSFQ